MKIRRKLVDNRVNRLRAGFSGNSYGLPAHIDWSRAATLPQTKLFSLPLEVRCSDVYCPSLTAVDRRLCR